MPVPGCQHRRVAIFGSSWLDHGPVKGRVSQAHIAHALHYEAVCLQSPQRNPRAKQESNDVLLACSITTFFSAGVTLIFRTQAWANLAIIPEIEAPVRCITSHHRLGTAGMQKDRHLQCAAAQNCIV